MSRLGRLQLFLVAAVFVGAVRVGLSLLGFRRTRRTLALLARTRTTDPLPPARIAWAVAAAGRRMPGGSTCLVQALAAQALLARHGHAAQLRIGIAQAGDGINAHAWLERDGQLLFGQPGPLGHTILPALEPRSP
jgi:hypothetical protein